MVDITFHTNIDIVNYTGNGDEYENGSCLYLFSTSFYSKLGAFPLCKLDSNRTIKVKLDRGNTISINDNIYIK